MVRVAHASRVLVSASLETNFFLFGKPGIQEAGKNETKNLHRFFVSRFNFLFSCFPNFFFRFS